MTLPISAQAQLQIAISAQTVERVTLGKIHELLNFEFDLVMTSNPPFVLDSSKDALVIQVHESTSRLGSHSLGNGFQLHQTQERELANLVLDSKVLH